MITHSVPSITACESTCDGSAYATLAFGSIRVEWRVGIVRGYIWVLVSLLLVVLRGVGIMGIRLLAVRGLLMWILIRIRWSSILVLCWCTTTIIVSWNEEIIILKTH